MRKYITKDICEEWYKADAARFVEFEILIVAAVIGFLKRSLLVFGGVFFVLLLCLKHLRHSLVFCVSRCRCVGDSLAMPSGQSCHHPV